LEKILTDTGYRAQLEQDGSVEAETRLQNIGELVAGATAYVEANNEPNVSAFLQDIALVTDADEVQTDGGSSVTLMTLHSAKGLEFPVVFVSGMEEGLFPIAGSLQDSAELEEERRLFYVGLTRAQKLVFLSYAQRRRRFNEWANTQPSRFLREIPDELLKWDTRSTEEPGRHILDQRRFREDGFVGVRGTSTRRIPTVGDEFSQESSYADDFSQTTDSFLAIGHHVMHPMFGRGRITAREGLGLDTKLTIHFDSGQTKKILVRVAHLEPCV
ncbi:MAG TPA: 3'-5' exonuclease, partial [Candidatus Latescibacteria bacterium]|nr:3'-5' exonuclease [Candidatus Latescibacterota bacterium]